MLTRYFPCSFSYSLKCFCQKRPAQLFWENHLLGLIQAHSARDMAHTLVVEHRRVWLMVYEGEQYANFLKDTHLQMTIGLEVRTLFWTVAKINSCPLFDSHYCEIHGATEWGHPSEKQWKDFVPYPTVLHTYATQSSYHRESDSTFSHITHHISITLLSRKDISFTGKYWTWFSLSWVNVPTKSNEKKWERCPVYHIPQDIFYLILLGSIPPIFERTEGEKVAESCY